MRQSIAAIIANHHLVEHGLSARWPPWQLVFTQTRKRLGCCSFRRREIELSAPFVEVQEESEEGERAVREVVLHEIAHALAGVPGHGPIWKKFALALGCDRPGKTLPDWIKLPAARFTLSCPSCGKEYRAHQRIRKMDKRYCGNRAHGARASVVGDERFRLIVRENREVI